MDDTRKDIESFLTGMDLANLLKQVALETFKKSDRRRCLESELIHRRAPRR